MAERSEERTGVSTQPPSMARWEYLRLSALTGAAIRMGVTGLINPVLEGWIERSCCGRFLLLMLHQPLAEVVKWLRSVVQGYFYYHAVPGNIVSLRSVRLEVSKRWFWVLHCRSQKSRITWKRLAGFVE